MSKEPSAQCRFSRILVNIQFAGSLVSNRTFTATGFTILPTAMVYTSAMNAVRFSSIATSEASAATVQRHATQTVNLNVEVSHIPMSCPLVTGLEEKREPSVLSNYSKTTNIVMANWSKAMWQSVVDRAVRMLASGPLGLHFLSARATYGGN
ncbi:hypothetical protein KIN20_026277 [Parelaphostrongylus tenuis]|uniref:Uncharacterized protein n=1 Tax=Parelaphostrongylus tenuis TaxID=148309 RepID=A0AAD5MWH4_PARTN|nr:hypothetical protein KIN20_026277 [Parelaphostrongylus tenuis]